jgi:uncharacterized membrane protein
MVVLVKKNFFGIAATTLRAGVWISAIFLIGALVDSVVAQDAVTAVTPAGLAAALRGIFRLDTGALVHLGIVVLLLTPIARLVAVATEFIIRRETSFVMICVGVLLLLGASVGIGLL